MAFAQAAELSIFPVGSAPYLRTSPAGYSGSVGVTPAAASERVRPKSPCEPLAEPAPSEVRAAPAAARAALEIRNERLAVCFIENPSLRPVDSAEGERYFAPAIRSDRCRTSAPHK